MATYSHPSPYENNNNNSQTDKTFNKIWRNITLSIDITTLIKFSSTFFKTLALRNPNKLQFTTSFIITNLFNVPFPIGERMFSVIRPKNEENEDIIYQSQFNSLIETIYHSSFEQKANFFFKLIDFDEDNIIHENDMQMFFLHLEYKNYQQKQEELKSIIHAFFNENNKNKTYMTLEEYLVIITKNSDVVLLFYCLLFERQLIDEDVLNYYKINIMIDQEDELFFSKTKSIKHNKKYLPLSPCNNNNNQPYLNRTTTHESKNESMHMERQSTQISTLYKTIDYKYTRKYSPTKKLIDLLNKSGHFNLSLDYDSYNGITKATNDIVDEDENEYNVNDLQSLCSFENDVQNYFHSLTKKVVKKIMVNEYKENNLRTERQIAHIKEKHSFEINPNNLNLKKLQLKQLGVELKVIEFDLVLFQKGIKTKIVIIGNFLFVYYIQENKNKIREKLTKIILLKHSFITVNTLSYSSQGDKKPFSYTATIYFLEKKFIFCFFSEGKRNKFVRAFNKINPHKTFEHEYNKHELISQGHFGKIFLVEHIQSNKLYVEKLIHKTNSSAKEIQYELYFANFFLTFKHPHIITFIETYETFDNVHLIMEYLPNGSFDKHLTSLSNGLIMKFLYQAISAINFVHSYSIIHRDIKYENFIVDLNEKKIKLIDFGLSKVNFPTEMANESCGTVSYSAPEIVEDIPYNLSIDIWSFGVMLYLFLFKEFPTKTKAFNREVIKLEQQMFFKKKKGKTKGFWEENYVKMLINKILVKESNNRMKGIEIEKMIFDNEMKM